MKIKIISAFTLLTCLFQSYGTCSWVTTSETLTFDTICAKNGKLIGITKKNHLPYERSYTTWKQISPEAVIALTTDGRDIVGVKHHDQNAYNFSSLQGNPIAYNHFHRFDSIGIGKDFVVVRENNDYQLLIKRKNDITWRLMENKSFWHMNTNEDIMCAIEQNNNELNNNQRAYMWKQNAWHPLGSQKFTQLATNGKTIVGIGIPFSHFVYLWTGKHWKKLGNTTFSQIAYEKDILCGITAEGYIMTWDSTKKTWNQHGNKKFVGIATDGKIIYGLDELYHVYYWKK